MTQSPSLILPSVDIPGVTIGVTTRRGGVSQAPFDALNLGDHVGDNPAHVRENRARLQSVLPEQPICWLRQVHGNRTVLADHTDCREADAHWTAQRDTPLAILTADCLPVVIAAKDASCVGIAHAGWRGLSNGILESLLTTLPLAPAQLFAWLGPAISVNAYEVGDDVRQCLLKTHGEEALHYFHPSARTTGRWMADLPGLATLILHRGGIDTITASRSCTVAEPQDFFSHRRDGPDTGRMATVVWRA